MIDDTETSFCLTASMGMGGWYVPMIVVEEDDAEDIHGEEVL